MNPAEAAKVLCESGPHLDLLHTFFDDARQRGLPPHHAINAALAKMANLKERVHDGR